MNDPQEQLRQPINGDERLTISERLSYLLQNTRRNLFSGRSAIRAHPFYNTNISGSLLAASPSRAMSEAFLSDQLQMLTPKRDLRILDIGCGSGRISDVFAAAGYTGQYTGIDIGNRFSKTVQHPEAFQRDFIKTDALNFKPDHDFDLIFSFSALEHIQDDTHLVIAMDNILSVGGAQLHIVPTAWGLPVYLWHGYRQYTLADIEQRFSSHGVSVFALGGAFSFLLHLFFITILEMLLHIPSRKWFRGIYMGLHRMCLKLDRLLPFAPTAYAIYKPKSVGDETT